MFGLAAVGLACAVSAVGPASGRLVQSKRDSVQIVSVSPSQPVRRGLPMAFVVEVSVNLSSADSATLILMTNRSDPVRFETVARTAIAWPDPSPLAFNPGPL